MVSPNIRVYHYIVSRHTGHVDTGPRGHWNQNLGRLPAPGGWTKTTSRGGEAVGAGAAAVRRRAPGPGVPGQRGRGAARGPALPQQLGVEVGVSLGVFTETKIFIH